EPLGLAFVFGQQVSDPGIVAGQQLGQVAVGQQGALFKSLLAEADGFGGQALRSRVAVEASSEIVGGAQLEHDRNEPTVDDALVAPWRIVAADAQPEDLAVAEVVAGLNMLANDFEDHRGAELLDTGSSDLRNLRGDTVGQGC